MNISRYDERQQERLKAALEKNHISLLDILEGRAWFGHRMFINAKCEYWMQNHRHFKKGEVKKNE